jgi:hypothetical protein
VVAGITAEVIIYRMSSLFDFFGKAVLAQFIFEAV